MPQYTLEELKELKYKWYEEAGTCGWIDKIYMVGRILGKPASTGGYGPKYNFDENGIAIYVDDYGHYMTVHYNGKLVCSTHPTERLFIKSGWMDVVQSFIPALEEEQKKREALKVEEERKKLAQQLGLE